MSNLVTWQQTIQQTVDEGGSTRTVATVNPVVTVRIAASGDLAELFDRDGDPINNPITGSPEGFVQFSAAPGTYTVKAVYNDSESQEWEINLINAFLPNDEVDARALGVVVLPHGDPEPSQADAIANAEALQEAIDTTSEDGRTLVFPEGVIWVAKYIIRKSNSIARGSRKPGASVIKMHGSVHRNMPLCISSTRGETQSNIHWADITFDFNRFRWSRQANASYTGVEETTEQADFYGENNIITFDQAEREDVFGAPSGALTQSAFIASDHNPIDSGLRSTYTRIRGVDGYKHSIDVTAPSYMRGQEPAALGLPTGTAQVYDPQPACGIDIFEAYAVGAGDDCITTHHCTDINFHDAFGDVTSGVRTGNTNVIEVDDASRFLNFYGRSIVIGGTTGVEVKGHSDTPAPWKVHFEHVIAVNNCLGVELRHLGHHRVGSQTFQIIGVDQGAGTFTFAGNLEETLDDADTFEVSASTGNNGLYAAADVAYNESADETIVTIEDDPENENVTGDILLAIPSSVADGEVVFSGALLSQTARDVHFEKITVIAPRRLFPEDDSRIVYYRNDARRAFSYKGYEACTIGHLECYEGDEPDLAELFGLEYQWLPTDHTGTLVRPFLNSRDLKIGTLKISGFHGSEYGVYCTGTFGRGGTWGGLYIDKILSRNGPRQVVRATSAVDGVVIGSYDIVGNHLSDPESRGLRLSGANTRKNLGPGRIEGYSIPVTWGGILSEWTETEVPVGFSQSVSSEQGFVGIGPDNRFGNWYSEIGIPVAGQNGYILLADLANGNHNISGTIVAKRSNNVVTANHAIRMNITTSSGSDPQRRSLFWDVQSHSDSGIPTLVHITEGGKNWLAIKAPDNGLRPLAGSTGQFTGRAIWHPDLFRIVPADAEGGAVTASEVPARNTGVGNSDVTPVWQFQGYDVVTTTGWQDFVDVAFTSGGDNLSFDYCRYKLDGETCTITGRIVAGTNGGTSSDSVNINLPFAAKKESSNVANPGSAFWRSSGGAVENRRPATAAVRTDGEGILFIAENGTIAGNDMTTTNGEIAFTLTYEIDP